jgi:hypothetical protein
VRGIQLRWIGWAEHVATLGEKRGVYRLWVGKPEGEPGVDGRIALRWIYRKGSTSCVPHSRNWISCAPRCRLHVYQLRPELTTSNMTSCAPQLVRNCISCIERYGYTKCPTIGRFLHSFIVLYFIHNYMHTYRIVEWYRQHSCYIMLLSNV